MEKWNVGVLHPGTMGISVAATVQKGGHHVYWVSERRSRQTEERAQQFHLFNAGTLAELCKKCDVLISICPPHAAEEMARQVTEHTFRGLYLDANAISPQRAKRIGRIIEETGGEFVDGGIIGGPAWEPGQTWLYLSGAKSADVADLFVSGPMETAVIGEEIGQASALKMCFAAYTKARTALLCAILAAAEELGVRDTLNEQWSRSWPGFAEETAERVRGVTAKAWRFAGEMEEIAATFMELGLPGEFHLGAEQVYRRIAKYKDAPSKPPLEAVLESLLQASSP